MEAWQHSTIDVSPRSVCDLAPAVSGMELRGSLEDPNVNLNDPNVWRAKGWLGAPSESGVSVTAETALNLAPFFSGVDIISGDVAKLPLHLYRKEANGGRVKDIEHPAYRLVRRNPNREQNWIEFWQQLVAWSLIWGQSFAYIDRETIGGAPRELIPLLPDRTCFERRNGKLYVVTEIEEEGGKVEVMDPADVFVLRGLTLTNENAVEIVQAAREAIGQGLAQQGFAAKFFKNGANASGVLMTAGRLSEDAQRNLKTSFEKEHSGLGNAAKTIILEEGTKYQRLTMAPQESQLVEGRQENRRDIAAYLRIPPHKIGDPERTSYNSLEAENAAYLRETLDIWLCRIAAASFDKLLTEEQKDADDRYFEHETKSLLRTDTATRFKAYLDALETGAMTPNMIAAAENWEPIGPDGDRRFIRGNLMPLDAPVEPKQKTNQGEQPLDEKSPEGKLARATLARVFKRLHAQASKIASVDNQEERIARMVRANVASVERDQEEIRRVAAVIGSKWDRWLEDHDAEFRNACVNASATDDMASNLPEIEKWLSNDDTTA